jgi:hypothetical protein
MAASPWATDCLFRAHAQTGIRISLQHLLSDVTADNHAYIAPTDADRWLDIQVARVECGCSHACDVKDSDAGRRRIPSRNSETTTSYPYLKKRNDVLTGMQEFCINLDPH